MRPQAATPGATFASTCAGARLGWNGIWFRADRDRVLKGDPDRPR
jgi:hypothetical protein